MGSMSNQNHNGHDGKKGQSQAIDLAEINRRIGETKKRLRFLLRERREAVLLASIEPAPYTAEPEDPERFDGMN